MAQDSSVWGGGGGRVPQTSAVRGLTLEVPLQGRVFVGKAFYVQRASGEALTVPAVFPSFL